MGLAAHPQSQTLSPARLAALPCTCKQGEQRSSGSGEGDLREMRGWQVLDRSRIQRFAAQLLAEEQERLQEQGAGEEGGSDGAAARCVLLKQLQAWGARLRSWLRACRQSQHSARGQQKPLSQTLSPVAVACGAQRHRRWRFDQQQHVGVLWAWHA